MLLRVLDPVVVALERGRVGGLLGHDLLEPLTRDDPHPGGRGEGRSRDHGAQLDELPRRDVQRAQDGLRPRDLHVAADVDGMAPRAEDPAGRRLGRGEAAERLLPFGAPDLEIHVDDVVVGDRDAREAVVDPERPEPRRAPGSARRCDAMLPTVVVPNVPGASEQPSSVQPPGR